MEPIFLPRLLRLVKRKLTWLSYIFIEAILVMVYLNERKEELCSLFILNRETREMQVPFTIISSNMISNWIGWVWCEPSIF